MSRGKLSIAFAFLLASLAVGCSSTRVYANYDPGADFSTYRTYGFVAELGTDDPQYGSLLSEFLKDVARRELEARGYTFAEEPDLVVNFYLRTENRVYSVRQPAPFYAFRQRGFWSYDVWGGYAGYETSVRQFTEGALHVDVVDRARRQVVWEAVVVDRLRVGDLEDRRNFAEKRLTQAFAEYRFRAGESAPSAP